MSNLQYVLKLKAGDIAYIPALGLRYKRYWNGLRPCPEGKDRNWILILTKGFKGMDFTRFATKPDAIKMRNMVFNMK